MTALATERQRGSQRQFQRLWRWQDHGLLFRSIGQVDLAVRAQQLTVDRTDPAEGRLIVAIGLVQALVDARRIDEAKALASRLLDADIPALRVTGLIARTNVASNTAFRGFGGPQGMIVMEEIIDRIARRVGLAPEVVRGRNLYRGRGRTNTTHFLQEIGDNRLQTVWKRVRREAGFAARRRAVDAWNRAHPGVKRGLAVTPLKFGISFTLTHYNQAGALVLLYSDGTAQVNGSRVPAHPPVSPGRLSCTTVGGWRRLCSCRARRGPSRARHPRS